MSFNQPLMAWGQDAPQPAPTAAPVSTIPGQLLNVDGRAPWVGKVVRVVRTPTLELVAEVTTDAEGRFSLPLLEPGTYLVTVGKMVTTVAVTEDQPVRELRIVANEDLVNGETIPMADLQAVAEMTGTTYLLVGGGILVIAMGGVAGGVIWYNTRRTTGGRIFGVPISPFTP